MCDRDCKEALDRWLDTATDGLCDVAKQRVANEIRAHYAEAVETEVAQGQSEDKAHGIALAALGDARRARKAFRRIYLTNWEAALVLGMGNGSRHDTTPFPLSLKPLMNWLGRVLFLLCLVLALGILAGFVFGFSERWHTCLAGSLSLLVITYITAFLQPHLMRDRRWRRAAAWSIITMSLMPLTVWLVSVNTAASEGELRRLVIMTFGAMITVGAAACALCIVLLTVSAVRKLGKHTELYDSFLSGDDRLGPV